MTPADAPRLAHHRLESLVARSRIPGAQYLVIDAADTRFAYCGGSARYGPGAQAMTPATTMMAYSMSKTITAVAVLQLVESGRVGLDEPVARYSPGIPYPGITVRQALSHLSGAPNPIPLRWVHPAAAHDTFDERAALAKVLRAHSRPSFPPGARYAYSNIGYWLLGSVVEAGSGEAFCEYVRSHVTEPLGIRPTELGYRIPESASHAGGYLERWSLMNLAKGFLLDRALIGETSGSWVSIRSHYVNGAAFGGLVGTAAGFGAFLADQLAPRSRLLGDATRALLYQPQRSAHGAMIPMTLGWHAGRLQGTAHYYKEGGGGGFHAMMRIYPERGVATVLMVNATGFDVTRCLDTLDAPFLA